jgi:hypothetical protein
MSLFQTRRNVSEDKGNCDSGCLSEKIMDKVSYFNVSAVGNKTGECVWHTYIHRQQTQFLNCNLALNLSYEHCAVLLSPSQHKCSCQYQDFWLDKTLYQSTYPIKLVCSEIRSSPQLRLLGYRGFAVYKLIRRSWNVRFAYASVKKGKLVERKSYSIINRRKHCTWDGIKTDFREINYEYQKID